MTKRIHAYQDDPLGTDDATAIAHRIRCRDISPLEATEAAINRVIRINPALNAVAWEQFERAKAQASQQTFSGFFSGVPSLIKDNIDVEGMPTGHGSSAVNARPAIRNGRVARHYLAQGFNLLGKTHLPAFGFTATTERLGADATRNPWGTDFSSGGSSGGSAALVAAGAVPIAHGNDAGGSIRIPASCCGLVGLKSSRGRFAGVESINALPVNIVCEGVLTRSVRDTANYCAEAERHYRNRKMQPIGQVTAGGVRRLKVGVMVDSITGPTQCHETRISVEKAASLMASLGHHVEEARLVIPPRFKEDFLLYWAMLAYVVSKIGSKVLRTELDADKLDPLSKGLANYYRKRMLHTPAMIYHLRRSWQQYADTFKQYDVIVSPVVAHVTPVIGYLAAELPFEIQIERLLNYITFTPANNASGGPAISLPLGKSGTGLPIGIQLSAGYGNERTLLELAFELEAAQPFSQLYDDKMLYRKNEVCS